MSPVEVIDGEVWIVPMPTPAVLPAEVDEPTVEPCHTPGCRQDAGHGVTGLFCVDCAANLARIAAELREEAGMRCISFKNGRKTFQRLPKCCNPYCSNDRRPPAPFCESCVDAGYVDEAA